MLKINKIAPYQSSFLQIISTIDTSVKSLFYSGTLPQQRLPAVAIVGTRKPTPYGQEVAYRLSNDLASKGVVIISGLAYGIDAIVHRAALDAKGITIAVLPTSLEQIHPAANQKLAQEIVATGGALLSEYSSDQPVFKTNFLARNRIVSGLSDVLLIVEAAERSGTLATVGFALNQGKTVMAIPGNITNPMSVGCNNLIKKGATPVTSTKDILQELDLGSRTQPRLPFAYSNEEESIINVLASGVRDGEELQQQSGLHPAEFNQTMTMLEIHGKIRALGANQWTLQ